MSKQIYFYKIKGQENPWPVYMGQNLRTQI